MHMTYLIKAQNIKNAGTLRLEKEEKRRLEGRREKGEEKGRKEGVILRYCVCVCVFLKKTREKNINSQFVQLHQMPAKKVMHAREC